MAKYRSIQTSFWSDSKIIEDFTPEDRYFYLYLLTNEKSNQRQSVLHRHSKGTWILVQHGEQKRLRLGLRNAVQNEIRAILPAL